MATEVLSKPGKSKLDFRLKNYERRYFPRWRVNKRIEYHLQGCHGVYRSFTKDMTLEGVAFFTTQALPQDKIIKIKVYLSDQEYFHAEGNAIWSKDYYYQKLTAVVFKELDGETREMIADNAFKIKDDDLFVYGLGI